MVLGKSDILGIATGLVCACVYVAGLRASYVLCIFLIALFMVVVMVRSACNNDAKYLWYDVFLGVTLCCVCSSRHTLPTCFYQILEFAANLLNFGNGTKLYT